MKYQVGDTILVKLTDEEGKVVEIINDKMVMIEVRGVKYPAYMDQIDFPYFKMFTAKRAASKKKIHVDDVIKEKNVKRQKVQDGVYLRFFPVYSKDVFDDDIVQKLKVYLINFNEENYLFDYNLYFGAAESSFQLKARVDALSEIYLHDIDFDDISDNPRFEFVFHLEPANKKRAAYFERMVKVNGKKVFKKIEEITVAHEPSFEMEVFLQYPEKAEEPEDLNVAKLAKTGYRLNDLSKLKDVLAPKRTVVDLHIDKITDNWDRMSAGEILHMQLNEFEKFYDLALAHRQPVLTIIHGIGIGRLKDELHQALKAKKEVKSFINQYSPQYGYGATEIFFK